MVSINASRRPLVRLFSRAKSLLRLSNNISRRTLSTLLPPLFLTSIDCNQNCESFATAAWNSPSPSSVGPSLRVHARYSKRTRHHHAHPQPVDSIFRWHTDRSSLNEARRSTFLHFPPVILSLSLSLHPHLACLPPVTTEIFYVVSFCRRWLTVGWFSPFPAILSSSSSSSRASFLFLSKHGELFRGEQTGLNR